MSMSLRNIRIRSLKPLLRDVEQHQFLGGGTEPYAVELRERWRRLISCADHTATRGARAACVRATAAEIRGELADLEASTDAGYAEATKELPLSYWAIMPPELGEHVHARGLEGREWYERFGEFPAHVAGGMGGWGWYRIGEERRLSYDEVLPILGHNLATKQLAPKWAGAAARVEAQS